MKAKALTPILYVDDLQEAIKYYVEVLTFEHKWSWGDPADFAAVGFGEIEIFFCEKGQGSPGMWLSIFIDNIDGYLNEIKNRGAMIQYGPRDEPWGCREIHVKDPNNHIIRFTQSLEEGPC